MFNVNIFFSLRGYIGGPKKYVNMKGGGARGAMLAHGLQGNIVSCAYLRC
jgi:hypothetical protein